MHNCTHNHEATATTYKINYSVDYFTINCTELFVKQNATFTQT